MENHMFDNPAHLNHYHVYEGMRCSEPATRPSVYISCLKLRKAFRLFTNEEIEDIFEQEMGVLGIKVHREKLDAKLEDVHDWQLFYALYLLINDPGAFEAAKFIAKARWDDACPFIDEYEIYNLIQRKR